MEGENYVYKKGLWTEEEDKILMEYIRLHGRGKWNRIPKMPGLKRGGKSCRLRWVNYLCPNVKRDEFSEEEDDLVIRLHNLLGNRWSLIAGRVPGRTDNQVKNRWNIHLCKKVGVKNKFREIVGSSKTQSTKHETTTLLQDEVTNNESESMAKICIQPQWFSNINDQFNLSSPNFMEILDGYTLDPMW